MCCIIIEEVPSYLAPTQLLDLLRSNSLSCMSVVILQELANVVESVRNAIGSTLHTGSHSRSSQQSPITSYNKPCKILEAQDDTAISVVSRDSGLPPDTEHLSLPPSSYHSSSTKHSFSGQYVMLQTLADESASHQEECPSPPAHTAAVDQLTPGGEIAETTASPPVTHSQQPLGHEEPAQYICSQCKRKAKQSSSRQEKAGGHQQSHRQHRTRTNKQSLTLTNVSQDKVENYLEYRFASISDKEQLDAKSMTFSEYVGDRNDDPREQRRQHCAQQRTQHRCQSADKSPAPENHA